MEPRWWAWPGLDVSQNIQLSSGSADSSLRRSHTDTADDPNEARLEAGAGGKRNGLAASTVPDSPQPSPHEAAQDGVEPHNACSTGEASKAPSAADLATTDSSPPDLPTASSAPPAPARGGSGGAQLPLLDDLEWRIEVIMRQHAEDCKRMNPSDAARFAKQALAAVGVQQSAPGVEQMRAAPVWNGPRRV